MTEQEKKFVASIQNKIKTYEIPTDIKECFKNKSGILTKTVYNDKTYEIVDTGIENLLICKSFNYWLSNYAMCDVPNKGTVPFKPYYYQAEMAKEIENYRKVVIDKTRQCGMSTVFALYCLWRLLSRPSENIDVISLTQAKSFEFVKKFKTTIEIQPDFFMKEIIENNKQKMRFKHPNGAISTITSESQTENAGRSDSLSLLVLDELAFYKSDRMVQSIISAAIPTLTRTAGSQIYISTPNGTVGAGAYYYNQVQEAKMGLDRDTKYMQIGWWEIPDDENMNGPKRGYNRQLAQAISEDYYHHPEIRKKWEEFFEPIGKDPNANPFLKSQYGSLGEFKYRQEILHEFIISGDRVLTPDNMIKIKTRLKTPIMKDYLCLNGSPVKEMHNFWIWKHPEASKKYIVTLDPSQGTSQDRACIQVLDIMDMEQVAEFYGFAATTQLPGMVKDIARVYNDAYVVIEANSIGDGVFNALYYNQNDPYGNVFKQKKSNNGITRFTGWITDTKTRKLMTTEIYDWFTNAEMFSRFHLYSERVYTELETWIVDAKGKFIHATSCHDDSIMALALALYNRDKAAHRADENQSEDDLYRYADSFFCFMT